MGQSPDPKHYKPLESLVEWADNYNTNDCEAIARSIQKFGFNVAPRVWRDNIIMANNHATKSLRLLQSRGEQPPSNVIVHKGEWFIRWVDVSHLSDTDAKAFAIADNELARKSVVNDRLLAEYLQQIVTEDEEAFRSTGYSREGLDSLLASIGAKALNESVFNASPSDEQAGKLRKIDIIYTSGTLDKGGEGAAVARWVQVHCCLAVKSGWLYGVRSSDGVCATAERQEAHHPQFIDNHYHNYDHAQHLGAVKLWRPKYATVRDLMTPEQCQAAGIDYYPYEQIIDFAEEIAQYAENVILIPKYDCIDRIPEKFMLGYSVPTSYGGTPLTVEHFKGRRVHLLGGSPRRQIQYWQALEDEVVSLDNNYILKVSGFGQVWQPDGTTKSLTDLGFEQLTNPLYSSLVLNFGLFAAFFHKRGDEDALKLLHSFEETEHEHEGSI